MEQLLPYATVHLIGFQMGTPKNPPNSYILDVGHTY